jgi:hypothetical protein
LYCFLLLLPNCLSCIPPVYLIALCVFLIKISTYLSKVFEDQLMALLTAIEASWHQNGVGSVPELSEKTSNKGNRELRDWCVQ